MHVQILLLSASGSNDHSLEPSNKDKICFIDTHNVNQEILYAFFSISINKKYAQIKLSQILYFGTVHLHLHRPLSSNMILKVCEYFEMTILNAVYSKLHENCFKLCQYLKYCG